MDNLLSTLHADLEKVISDHDGEISAALETAAKVADNPAAQAVLGLLHFPPASATALGEFLQKIDADFALLAEPAVPAAAAADPTAPAGSTPLFPAGS